jgi:hypothetical protein
MSDANDNDRALILSYFADIQEHDGDEELACFIIHCRRSRRAR